MKKIKIFLGGTWSKDNDWRREKLIPQLEKLGIDYFNPIIDNWTSEWIEEELRQKDICDFLLYVITKEMSGVYSIAEVVDDSNKRPQKTLFCYLEEGFSEGQIKSLKAVANLVEKNRAKTCSSLEEVVEYLNSLQLDLTREALGQDEEQLANQEEYSLGFLWNCCGNKN